MIKRWHKITFILIISFTLFTCIDPYTPDLKSFESLLVVDALVTDEDASNYVRITRTTETPVEDPVTVSDATVIISDDQGNSTVLTERYPGDYRTDSIQFRGAVGRTYTLSIETADGYQYESKACLMYPVPEIDSLYYTRDQVYSEETGTFREGVSFYIDTRDESPDSYYRWSYDEWWKFTVPEPKLFNYVNDSTIFPAEEVRQTCWGHKRSDIIDIENTLSGHSGDFIRKPVLFVAAAESNRLLIQYCAEVKQMSVSKNEYEFWNLMTEINDAGGDIFDKQPFQIFGNIKSITNPAEQVIGFFQVSAVSLKRRYITYNEVDALDLPVYRYECDRVEKGELDYPSDFPGGGLTFNEIYAGYLNDGYTFIAPILNANGDLYRLIFVKPRCADCTVEGDLKKPWFWVDLE
jgi:Domain of unknown function (DUF4249)